MKIVQTSLKTDIKMLDETIANFDEEILHWAIVDVTDGAATLSLIVVK